MRSLTRRGVVVEEVGGDDLEVVVGGVGEGAVAVAVAEGPDAGDVGAELVVDGDVAALVDGDAGFVEAEIVGVGAAAHGEQDVGAGELGRRRPCSRRRRWGRRRALSRVDALGVEADVDALFFEKVLDGGGDVFVFVLRRGVGPFRRW